MTARDVYYSVPLRPDEVQLLIDALASHLDYNVWTNTEDERVSDLRDRLVLRLAVIKKSQSGGLDKP